MRTTHTILTIAIGISILTGCNKNNSLNIEESPNYAFVFNDNEVQRIDIKISSEYWTVMQEDLVEVLSSSGGSFGFSDQTPVYVPCQVFHNQRQWYDVGIRYKGNSSLNFAYNDNINKLPFRLEFNHFEDENPLLNNQSFYGFKQLSFGNNFKDESFIHEKLASDIYREFGVPCSKTAFCRVYIDHGDGPVYYGMYTMIEVVFDTMLSDYFNNDDGNCYKPDGDGAKLNDPGLISSEFFINKAKNPGSLLDVTNFVNALLSNQRTSNPSLWRSNLESTFNVSLFLKWLAANTTMQNWDTYGKMTHNYYMYNNSSTGKLCWIPWDNNETFIGTSTGGGGGGPGGGGPGGGGPGGGGPGGGGPEVLAFDFSNLDQFPLSPTGDVAWPLIEYLYEDAQYKSMYDAYIDEFISSAFEPGKVTSKISAYHNLISPYIIGENGEQQGYTFLNSSNQFTSSEASMISFVQNRVVEAANYTP